MPTMSRTVFRWAVAAAALFGGAVYAEIGFEPSPIVITSRNEPVTVRIVDDGAPVAAGRIGGIRLRIEHRDYSKMMEAGRSDGMLRLTPTPILEIGTYDLDVFIDGRAATMPVVVTLEDEPSSLSRRAFDQGLTELDIRHQLGLYTEGRESVVIDLPEWMYVGKRISLRMPTPAGAAYQWHVNGEPDAQGVGAHTFTYPLTQPGRYSFRYVETGPHGAVIEAAAQTEAREEPPVAVRGGRSDAVRLAGPEGTQRTPG